MCPIGLSRDSTFGLYSYYTLLQGAVAIIGRVSLYHYLIAEVALTSYIGKVLQLGKALCF